MKPWLALALGAGSYTASGMPAPVCDLIKGHEGEHLGLMEWQERWL